MNNASDKRNVANGRPLSRNQKTSLLILAFFSLVVLAFGIWRIRDQIYSPFEYKNIGALAVSQTASSTTAIDYTTDTDKDGISDYEETNVYGTSIYLPDSDSDGFTDKEEIMHGTDPNCPTGQICTEILASTTPNVSSTTLAGLLETETTSSSSAITGSSSLESLLGGTSDVASLRQLLLDNGMDKATLDKISDADLMKSYQTSLQASQQQ